MSWLRLAPRRIAARGGDARAITASLLLTGALLLGAHSEARAQHVYPDIWLPNGFVDVRAFASVGDKVFVGGVFQHVGPYVGCGVVVDAVTGAVVPGFPKVNGRLEAVVDDGAGGWFIGGDFDSVGGQPRRCLAHVRADCTVDEWRADTDWEVYSLVTSGTTIYVGGRFSHVSGATRRGLAALDPSTGELLDWDPGPEGYAPWICALALRDTTLYVAGNFTRLGGALRNVLGAVSTRTARATDWRPVVSSSNWTPHVFALAADGTTLFVGGYFTSLGGSPRQSLGAVDLETGATTAWNPGSNPDTEIRALHVRESTLYVGGWIGELAGQPRTGVAAFDAGSGSLSDWHPDVSGMVLTIAAHGPYVYLGGDFQAVDGQTRNCAASVDATTGAVTPWNPGVFHSFGLGPGVHALLPGDSTVFLAGDFAVVGGVDRGGLAAFDATSLELLPHDVRVDSTGGIMALATSGDEVLVGGWFLSVGGLPRVSLAAIDANTGSVADWRADVNAEEGYQGMGAVLALATSGRTLYVGGSFDHVAGQPRDNLAAIDLETGEVTAWNPGTDNAVFALAVRDSLVYVGGGFTHIGGMPRDRIAALGAVSGVPSSWNPGADGGVAALAVDERVVYVGGVFDTIGGRPRRGLAALDAATGIPTAWNPSPNGVVHALALREGTLCIGGEFKEIGGMERLGLAAVRTDQGYVTAWDPRANGDYRYEVIGWPRVYGLGWCGSKVFAGGEFYDVGGVPGWGLAAMDDPTVGFTIHASSTGHGGWLEPIGSVVVPEGGSQTFVAHVSLGYRAQMIVDGVPVSFATSYTFADVHEEHTLLLAPVWTDVSGGGAGAPSFALRGRNPVSGTVRFDVEVPARTYVRVSVHDLAGRRLVTLVDSDVEPGRHELEWGAQGIRPGIYFARATLGGVAFERKLILLK